MVVAGFNEYFSVCESNKDITNPLSFTRTSTAVSPKKFSTIPCAKESYLPTARKYLSAMQHESEALDR